MRILKYKLMRIMMTFYEILIEMMRMSKLKDEMMRAMMILGEILIEMMSMGGYHD